METLRPFTEDGADARRCLRFALLLAAGGQGHTLEAAEAMLAFGFDQLGLRRI